MNCLTALESHNEVQKGLIELSAAARLIIEVCSEKCEMEKKGVEKVAEG